MIRTFLVFWLIWSPDLLTCGFTPRTTRNLWVKPHVTIFASLNDDGVPYLKKPIDNTTDIGAGRFGALSSSSRLPYFPRSLDALAWEAAASTVRAVDKGKSRLVVQLRLPGISGSGRGSDPRSTFSGGASMNRDQSVQQINVGEFFARSHPGGDQLRLAEADSPLLLLACCKLADELASLGMPRVRFVTQSYQTAVRLQAVVQQQDRLKTTNSRVDKAQLQQPPSNPKQQLMRRERSSAVRSANATAEAASRWAAVAAADKAAATTTSTDTAADAAAVEAWNVTDSLLSPSELAPEASTPWRRQSPRFDAALAGAPTSGPGAPPSVSEDASGAPTATGPVRKVRISVLGAMKRNDRKSKQLHYGIATDDEVVVIVAPSTSRRSEHGGNVLGSVEDIVGAAYGLKKPVVLLNPHLVRRNQDGFPTVPYLMASFDTAFWADTQAHRFAAKKKEPQQDLPVAKPTNLASSEDSKAVSIDADVSKEGAYRALQAETAAYASSLASRNEVKSSGSCALFKRWPYAWEAFFVDDFSVKASASSTAGQGYVFLGEFEEKPSTEELEAIRIAALPK